MKLIRLLMPFIAVATACFALGFGLFWIWKWMTPISEDAAVMAAADCLGWSPAIGRIATKKLHVSNVDYGFSYHDALMVTIDARGKCDAPAIATSLTSERITVDTPIAVFIGGSKVHYVLVKCFEGPYHSRTFIGVRDTDQYRDDEPKPKRMLT